MQKFSLYINDNGTVVDPGGFHWFQLIPLLPEEYITHASLAWAPGTPRQLGSPCALAMMLFRTCIAEKLGVA